MHKLVFAVTIVITLTSTSFAFSEIIYVPDDFQTIQEAIDNSADGDSVIVRSGIYMENINFLGKAITVKSEGGPDVTIIDGSNAVYPDSGNVVLFINGEGFDSVLEGFTITGGAGSNTYEAQLVKGNISPLGGREAAGSGDAKEPGLIS